MVDRIKMTDRSLFLTINGWAGHNAVLDAIITFIANDYFMIVTICLGMVFIWFGTRAPERRKNPAEDHICLLDQHGLRQWAGSFE